MPEHIQAVHDLSYITPAASASSDTSEVPDSDASAADDAEFNDYHLIGPGSECSSDSHVACCPTKTQQARWPPRFTAWDAGVPI